MVFACGFVFAVGQGGVFMNNCSVTLPPDCDSWFPPVDLVQVVLSPPAALVAVYREPDAAPVERRSCCLEWTYVTPMTKALRDAATASLGSPSGSGCQHHVVCMWLGGAENVNRPSVPVLDREQHLAGSFDINQNWLERLCDYHRHSDAWISHLSDAVGLGGLARRLLALA